VGSVITNWEQHHSIPIGAQRIAIASMLLSGVFCVLVINAVLIKLIALAFISFGIWFVSQIPSTNN